MQRSSETRNEKEDLWEERARGEIFEKLVSKKIGDLVPSSTRVFGATPLNWF